MKTTLYLAFLSVNFFGAGFFFGGLPLFLITFWTSLLKKLLKFHFYTKMNLGLSLSSAIEADSLSSPSSDFVSLS